MRKTLHRSENLHIYREGSDTDVLVELRFSESTSAGRCDGLCPRCGAIGTPAYWELEGPDGSQNTIWLSCHTGANCDEDTNWSRTVEFEDWKE